MRERESRGLFSENLGRGFLKHQYYVVLLHEHRHCYNFQNSNFTSCADPTSYWHVFGSAEKPELVVNIINVIIELLL